MAATQDADGSEVVPSSRSSAEKAEQADDSARGSDQESAATSVPRPMPVDAAKLKALAHPLRVRLYDLLSDAGPATASQLGAQLGESSGTTSYHLRQLASAGFIEEAADHGTRRDRYWRARPGGFDLDARRFRDDPSSTAVLESIAGELWRTHARLLERWYATGMSWGEPWIDGSVSNLTRFVGTPEEMADLRDEVLAVVARHADATRGRPAPEGAARIAAQFHVFPVDTVEEGQVEP